MYVFVRLDDHAQGAFSFGEMSRTRGPGHGVSPESGFWSWPTIKPVPGAGPGVDDGLGQGSGRARLRPV